MAVVLRCAFFDWRVEFLGGMGKKVSVGEMRGVVAGLDPIWLAGEGY